MARKATPILKNTKKGTMDVACSDCGKDQCPLMSKPGVYPVPEFKNCGPCRARKNGTRTGHVRRPPPGFALVSKASVPVELEPFEGDTAVEVKTAA
jgi:hypothetical protein